jgi:hypothetical protein
MRAFLLRREAADALSCREWAQRWNNRALLELLWLKFTLESRFGALRTLWLLILVILDESSRQATQNHGRCARPKLSIPVEKGKVKSERQATSPVSQVTYPNGSCDGKAPESDLFN